MNAPTVDLTEAIAIRVNELARFGWCILRQAMSAEHIERLDADLAGHFVATPFSQGGFYGTTTKRFGRLLRRSSQAAALVGHQLVLGLAEAILSPWCDCIQLNTTQAIGVHPGAPAQLPHRDQDMWRGPVGEIEYLVNVMWPLTEFTKANGATLIWPGSHGAHALGIDPCEAPVSGCHATGRCPGVPGLDAARRRGEP